MTNNLKCPFCGATLKEGYNDIVMSCFDTEPCPCYDGFKRQVYKALIDGKKAQRQLKTVKDRCVKKLKAKEREIASYLNGISVRQSENEKLAKQLKQARDALKIVDGKLKVIANDENPSPIQSQALDCYIQIAKDCRDTITSITKQEE